VDPGRVGESAATLAAHAHGCRFPARAWTGRAAALDVRARSRGERRTLGGTGLFGCRACRKSIGEAQDSSMRTVPHECTRIGEHVGARWGGYEGVAGNGDTMVGDTWSAACAGR
jgi:hypothetical protein